MPECNKCPIKKECESLKEFEGKIRETAGEKPRKVECYLTLAIGKAIFG